MGLWGAELLRAVREDYEARIERFMSPPCEEAFRSWAMAVTAPVAIGEKVQGSRTSEHAERYTDTMLRFGAERDARVAELQKQVERIDAVLAGEGDFKTATAALRWIKGV